MRKEKLLAATLAMCMAVSAPLTHTPCNNTQIYAASKPTKVTNVNVKVKNTTATITFSKVKNISGYQIVVANNKKFTNEKKVIKATKNTVTLTIKKNTKNLFVKVRAYKTKQSKRVYGAFSAIAHYSAPQATPTATPVTTLAPTEAPVQITTPTPTATSSEVSASPEASEAPLASQVPFSTPQATLLPTSIPEETHQPIVASSTAIVVSPTPVVASPTAIASQLPSSTPYVNRTYDFFATHEIRGEENANLFTNKTELTNYFEAENGYRLKYNPNFLTEYSDEFFQTRNYVVLEVPGDISGKDYAIDFCVKSYTVSEEGCLHVILNRTTTTLSEQTIPPNLYAVDYQFFTFVTNKAVTSVSYEMKNQFLINPNFNQVALAEKPVIYLYPTKEQQVTVTLGNPDALTCVYPAYNGQWNVLAKPDGTLTDTTTGRKLYSLYYEARNQVNFKQTEDGFVVKGSEAAAFLEEKLEVLGLNYREAEEFIIYWLPELEKNEYNYIRFATAEEIDANMPLKVSGNPDTILRVLMEYKAIDGPIDIKEQTLTTPNRTGFTVVEWGGTELQ